MTPAEQAAALKDALNPGPPRTRREDVPSAGPKAILLPCPCCGEAKAPFSVNLDSLDDPDCAFTCRSCDAEFGVPFVRDLVARWSAVCDWIDRAPAFEE